MTSQESLEMGNGVRVQYILWTCVMMTEGGSKGVVYFVLDSILLFVDFAIFFLFVVSTLSLPFYRFHLTTTATTYVTGMK